jgi:hypothetical protein
MTVAGSLAHVCAQIDFFASWLGTPAMWAGRILAVVWRPSVPAELDVQTCPSWSLCWKAIRRRYRRYLWSELAQAAAHFRPDDSINLVNPLKRRASVWSGIARLVLVCLNTNPNYSGWIAVGDGFVQSPFSLAVWA